MVPKPVTNLVQVPDFEHGLAIMERVSKEAVSSRKCVVFAPENRPVGHRQALEQREVVLSDTIGNVNRTAGNCPRSSMELGTRVSRLEHVPIWVNEVAHP